MTVKRKTAIFLMAAVLCALCAGCAGQEKTQSEPAKPSALNVYLTNGYKYAPIRVLENDALRAELENSLGVVIHMHYRDQQQDIGLLNTEEINGIILADDSTSIQTLADNAKIIPVDSSCAQMADSNYGRYLGLQYGYVFTKGKHITSPILLLAADKLEQAGIQNIPYTPEGWTDVLRRLTHFCSEPMAVYGAPTDPSYAPLLAMFGLSPQGGMEFSFNSGVTEYDKLSSSAREYLSFINGLYQEELLPKDMLSINCYSAGRKMLNNVSAITVFYDEAYIGSFLDYAESSGIRIAYAELPVSGRYLDFGMDDRLLGLVTSNYADKEMAMRFFAELNALSLSVEDIVMETGLEKYPLFEKAPEGALPDPDLSEYPESNILYQSVKKILDAEFILPYYSQIAVGEKPVSSFEAMCSLWRESPVTMLNNTFDGNSILGFYK